MVHVPTEVADALGAPTAAHLEMLAIRDCAEGLPKHRAQAARHRPRARASSRLDSDCYVDDDFLLGGELSAGSARASRS